MTLQFSFWALLGAYFILVGLPGPKKRIAERAPEWVGSAAQVALMAMLGWAIFVAPSQG